MSVNRRELLLAGSTAGAMVLTGCFSRPSRWEWLDEKQAGTLAVLCDQIIPADDWPSASQAGVVRFIDRQLIGPYHRHRKAYREGIAATEALCRSRFGTELAKCTADQQLEIAKALEQQNPAFFELVRRHTMQGYYGSPRHGGNKDAVSWHMLGLAEPPLRGRAQYDFTSGPKS